MFLEGYSWLQLCGSEVYMFFYNIIVEFCEIIFHTYANLAFMDPGDMKFMSDVCTITAGLLLP